jgi:hypothetical protein
MTKEQILAAIAKNKDTAIQRAKDTNDPDEEICTCGHVKKYHLFGGRSCADSKSHCPCLKFEGTGVYWDYGAIAKEYYARKERILDSFRSGE